RGPISSGFSSGRSSTRLPQITPSHDNQKKGRAEKKQAGDVDRDHESEFERRARKRNRSQIAAWDSIGRASKNHGNQLTCCEDSDQEADHQRPDRQRILNRYLKVARRRRPFRQRLDLGNKIVPEKLAQFLELIGPQVDNGGTV